MVIPIRVDSIPITQKGSIKTTLKPGEIQVLLVNDSEAK